MMVSTEVDLQMLGRAARSSSVLKAMAMTDNADLVASAIKELPRVPKLLLAKINFDIRGEGNTMAVLEELGNCATTLRDFTFYCNGQYEDEAFDLFVHRAQLLKKVHIVFDDGGKWDMESEARIENIVRAFSSCPNLQRLEIQDYAHEAMPEPLDSIAN